MSKPKQPERTISPTAEIINLQLQNSRLPATPPVNPDILTRPITPVELEKMADMENNAKRYDPFAQ